METDKNRTVPVLKAALLVLACAWIFRPALHGGWIWDDLAEVAHNSVLRDPAGLRKIWFAPAGVDYFPLKTTVQWIEWRLWGGHVEGYHALNIALHALGAILLWRVLARLGVVRAWFGGLLFAVHPLAVMSVAWISELKNTLSLPLMLGSALAYLAYDGADRMPDPPSSEGCSKTRRSGLRRPVAYALSLLLFLAALLAKTSVVMFPFVLLLHAWWRRGRVGRRDLLASASFFAASLGLGLVTLHFQEARAIGGEDLALGGVLPRTAAAGLAIAHYLYTSLLPVSLLPMYPRWALDPPSAADFLPWAALAALLGFLWSRRSGWGRHALFGLGFFLVMLAPVLGFVPMAYLRISRVADHLAYVPLAGLAGLAAACLGRIRGRTPALAAGLAVAAVLAVESRSGASLYTSEEALWTRIVERNPGAWIAQNNIGFVLAEKGRLPEAVAHYEESLRHNPRYAEARVNLGNAFVRMGRLPEAIAQLQEAVRLKPGFAQAHADLAVALSRSGRLREAMDENRAALRIDPGSAEAHNNLGSGYAITGRLAEAVAEYGEAIRLKPGYPAARVNLGNALSASGRIPEAIAQYREAIRLDPSGAEAHFRLGIALGNTDQVPAALGQFQEAARLSPADGDIRYNLGLALRALGREGEAQAAFIEAKRLGSRH
jgi:tetratricopeptide (TPR) repeat protein